MSIGGSFELSLLELSAIVRFGLVVKVQPDSSPLSFQRSCAKYRASRPSSSSTRFCVREKKTSASELIVNMGCMIMMLLLTLTLTLLIANVHCTTANCEPLVERFNSSTGPPRGQHVLKCHEQGTSFPHDIHLQLPSNISSTKTGRILSSSYADGSGTYISSDEVHHYASGVKCWSDYFVVESGYWFNSWVKASGDLYCTGTSVCSISHMDGHQTCETWSISISAGVESAFINFGITAGYEHQTCNSGTDTSQCSWSDKQCHCIWTQQKMTYQHGYKRRRCSSAQGDYTAWMQDVVHDAPTSVVNYGCGSKCTDT